MDGIGYGRLQSLDTHRQQRYGEGRGSGMDVAQWLEEKPEADHTGGEDELGGDSRHLLQLLTDTVEDQIREFGFQHERGGNVILSWLGSR